MHWSNQALPLWLNWVLRSPELGSLIPVPSGIFNMLSHTQDTGQYLPLSTTISHYSYCFTCVYTLLSLLHFLHNSTQSVTTLTRHHSITFGQWLAEKCSTFYHNPNVQMSHQIPWFWSWLRMDTTIYGLYLPIVYCSRFHFELELENTITGWSRQLE